MVTPLRQLKTGNLYHVYNRGVERRTIFAGPREYERFLTALAYYQQVTTSAAFSDNDFSVVDRRYPLRFHIVAYCLMPNHFHLVLEQLVDDGVRAGLSQLSTSYTKYFNARHERVGPLFQSRFQSLPILTDEYLVHVVRYVLLNPVVAGLADDPSHYRWSSYREAILPTKASLSQPDRMLEYFAGDSSALVSFISDHAKYARSLSAIKLPR